MSLVLFPVLIVAIVFGVVFAACALLTAPPYPLPTPKLRTPRNDVSTCRVWASERVSEIASRDRDKAQGEARLLAETVRRLEGTNAKLTAKLKRSETACAALAELKLPAALDLVAAHHARLVSEVGDDEGGGITKRNAGVRIDRMSSRSVHANRQLQVRGAIEENDTQEIRALTVLLITKMPLNI